MRTKAKVENIQAKILAEAARKGSGGVTTAHLLQEIRGLRKEEASRALYNLCALKLLTPFEGGGELQYEINTDLPKGRDGVPLIPGMWVFRMPSRFCGQVLSFKREGKEWIARVIFPGGVKRAAMVSDVSTRELEKAARTETRRGIALAYHTKSWDKLVKLSCKDTAPSPASPRPVARQAKAPLPTPPPMPPPPARAYVVLKLMGSEWMTLEEAREAAGRAAEGAVGSSYAVVKIEEAYKAAVVVSRIK